MDANLDKIALDLYGKIQTRFPDIKIGDENAEVLSKKEDIPNARFFEFEYEEDGEPLGTIAITLDSDDGVVVQVSGDLVNDNDDTTHHNAYKFIRSFRQFAKDRLLKFDVQNIGKSNMDKRDYEFQAKRKEEPVMEPVMENKLYGSNKISYQDLGEARLVVRHTQAVNPLVAAGRTMHIESIYIENAAGERFKYPFKHLNGARALAEHIKHGGNPYDAIGKHITSLSEELAHLRKFKGYVSRQEQVSEAMGSVTDRVLERIDLIKETIHKLQRPAYYESFVESFEAQDEQMIPEEIQNDLIDRLTIRTFNEELKAVFPYIYKFVDESELPTLELGVDDILGEDDDEGPKSHQAKTTLKHLKKTSYGDKADAANIKPGTAGYRDRIAMLKRAEEEGNLKDESYDPEAQFESFMDSLISEDKDEIFSPNVDAQTAAIEKLNKIMGQELKGGPEGVNAIQSLKGLIDNPEFLNSLRDIDPDLDIRPLIQQFVLATEPNIAAQLHFGGEEGGTQEPEAPPAPAPEAPPAPAPEAPPAPAPEAVPPAPVAEGKDEEDPPFDPDPPRKNPIAKAGKHGLGHSTAKHLAHQGIKAAIEKAKKAGATLDTKMDFGNKEMTLHDAIKECGLSLEECGFDASEGEGGIDQILKSIAGFWNKENRNFTIGGTRAKTKVIKGFKDGEFPNATPEDVKQVVSMIEKMDPSSNEHNQIMKLAGVHGHEQGLDEDPMQDQFAQMMQMFQKQHPSANIGQMTQQFQQANPGAKVTQSHTSSGTVNGKPASYDDAISQANNMKFKLPKFGDDDTDDDVLDFSNPDQIGQTMQKKIGGMMKGVQGQVPNQNVQFPGGQMNPSDMMKQIMQKINFGK